MFPDTPDKETDLEKAGNLRTAAVLSHGGVRAGGRPCLGETGGGNRRRGEMKAKEFAEEA